MNPDNPTPQPPNDQQWQNGAATNPPPNNNQPQGPAQPIYPQPTYNPTPAGAWPPPAAAGQPHVSAGTVVLQWLTYAFWGWTVLAMSFLIAAVVDNFISKSQNADSASYAIAAVLVLLPISIICDVLYSKQEPLKKTGASSIVMVIHAVIFALFAIGSLIGAVFSIVSILTSDGDKSSPEKFLIISLIIFVLYSITFVRTLNPGGFGVVKKFYVMFMTTAVGVIALMGLLGPVARVHATKTDRLIENNLSGISAAVSNYVSSNNRMPASLTEVTLFGDQKSLVDNKLVTYKQDGVSLPKTTSYSSSYAATSTTVTSYRYQLCVDYKQSKQDKYASSYNNSYLNDSAGYSTDVRTYAHPKGHVCYKLRTY